MIKVKFIKLWRNATTPRRGSAFAAGYDLTAIDYKKEVDFAGDVWVYSTGIAVELPPGYCGLLMPRSSICRTGAVMCNGVGLLDEDYRGEITFKFYGACKPYNVGERIGQLVIMPVPAVEFEQVEALGETERGAGGYGSTGK